MRFTEVRFSKKVSNETKPSLGKYENEELEITAIIGEDESISDCTLAIVKEVFKGLGIDSIDVDTNAKLEVKEDVTTPEEPKPAKKAPAKKATPAKKAPAEKAAAKPKHIEYSRDSKELKVKFLEVLAGVDPTWKSTDDGKAAGKATSLKSIGFPMVGEDGKILDTFVAKVKEIYEEELGV